MKLFKKSFLIFYIVRVMQTVNSGKGRRRNRAIAEINVVPYIDVMLVLLLIFMITAPLLTEGVQVRLPNAQAKTLSSQEKTPIVISVNAQGQYFLNIAVHSDKPMEANEIATRVAAELEVAKQAGQKRPVMVKGDKAVDYGAVVRAMVILQAAGAKTVGLVTEPGNDINSSQSTNQNSDSSLKKPSDPNQTMGSDGWLTQ